MRATSYLLPSLLLTTQIQAVPAWLSPSYSVPTTLLDPGHNKLGAVASESAICSEIGTAALQAGGNAADAMVASTLCVGGMSDEIERDCSDSDRLFACCAMPRRSLID
ncbi:hypothetical protein LTR12_001100 [Friedmanniomyces endolithicus]|nr:hypothetical protein LTR12_001100 [Friedmanniomyces endolithicus]